MSGHRPDSGPTERIAPDPGQGHRHRRRHRHRHRRASQLAHILAAGLRWSGAGLALVALVVLLGGFPGGHPSLLPVLGLYGLACVLSPYSWLLLLPVLLVTYDLTPWSGRAGFNELDMLVMLTLAVGWIRPPKADRATPAAPANGRLLLVWGSYLLLLVAVGVGQGGIQSGPLLGLAEYAPDVALLQSRGMVYALLLFSVWLPLYRSDPGRAERTLLLGGCLAALALALVLAWERGVFADLFSGGAYYQRLRSLLDFSTTYRVTGVFSEMHAGGETIDGILMILIPLALVATFRLSGWRQWLAAVAFLGASYGLVSTFTRATYASYGLCLVLFALLVLIRRRELLARLNGRDWWILAGTGLALLLLGAVYRLSGYMGLLAGGLILVFGLWAAAFPRYGRRNLLVVPVYGALVALGLYGQLTSKWIDAGPLDLLIQACLLCFISLASGLFARRFRLQPGPMLLAGSTLLLLAALLVSVLGGYRMSARVATLTTDLETRTDHWRDVLEAMDTGGGTLLFGMGRGSFAAAYALSHPQKAMDAGGLRILEGEGGRYLRLGRGNDLTLAQRLAVQPGHSYRISMRIRNGKKTALSVGFCERNIIYASDFGVNCAERWLGLEASPGRWQTRALEIESQGLGAPPIWKRWPTVFYLKNAGPVDIEVDDIEVRAGELRFNLIDNGDFEQGLDFWYTYNDFKHLPWHIKNLLLALWFEGGLLGIALTALLLLAAFKRALAAALSGDGLAMGAGLSVAGVLTVGAFGNPLDSARAALLFYWLLAVLAFSPPAKPSANGD